MLYCYLGLRKCSIEKMNSVNVKKNLLFEDETNIYRSKNITPHGFGFFKGQSSFLQKVFQS